MRVLFIPSRYPLDLRRGDELRAYQHVRELAKRHAITLLAFAPARSEQSAVDTEIRTMCERVVMVERNRLSTLIRLFRALAGALPLQTAMNDTREFRAQLADLLRTSRFDVAHVQLARMGEALPLLGSLPCVLDLIDALSANMARRARYDAGPMRLLAAAEAARLLPYERMLCTRVRSAAVSSDRDRESLGRDLAVEVVPNGIDPEKFVFSTQPREPNRLVFSGNLGYFPNVDAAVWFVREVLPLLRSRHPDVEIDLVGARPAAALRKLARAQPGVRLVGAVADMRPYLTRAAVALAPMRAGSGQQIKILEAMGCGTPVVATSSASAGLDAITGRDLLVGDDANTFADAVSRVLGDPALAARLARNGRILVEQHYTWECSARAIERQWHEAAGGAGKGRDNAAQVHKNVMYVTLNESTPV